MKHKPIGEIGSRNVCFVPPSATLGEVVARMYREHVTGVLVGTSERLLGIITERDVLQHAALNWPQHMRATAETVMSTPLVTAPPALHASEAYFILTRKQIRHLPLTDESGCVVGILTQSDMVADLGYSSYVALREVSRIMSRNVVTVGRETPFREALALMAGQIISCLVVCEHRRPVGILTERDVVRLLACLPGLDTAVMDQVMSSPVRCVGVAAQAHEAATIMRLHACRRLTVVDEDSLLAGILTESDIVRELEGEAIDLLKESVREKEVLLAEADRGLREKSAILDSILRSALDVGIVAADRDFRVTYFNPEAERILGARAADILGLSVQELHHGLGIDMRRLSMAVADVQNGQRHGFCFETGAGRERLVVKAEVSGIQGNAGERLGYVLMLRDITEQKRLETELRELATRDELTGLWNRRHFMALARAEISRAKRYGHPLTLAVLDIDHFKSVNDTYGHAAGDRVLEQIAGIFRATARDIDIVGRIGGEEFAIVLPETNLAGGIFMAERLRRAVQDAGVALPCGQREIRYTVSCGVAELHGDWTLTMLLRIADSFLYEAKRLGRNRVVSSCLNGHGADGPFPARSAP